MELPVIGQLKKDLDDLKHELTTKLPRELEEARAHGDLRENAEYEACKERQGYLTARIAQIEQRVRDLSMYTVYSIPTDSVGYGSTVTVQNLDQEAESIFKLVFPEEVDAAAGAISLGSPLGRALMNKRVGDEVVVKTPRGTVTYEIIELRTMHESTGSPSA